MTNVSEPAKKRRAPGEVERLIIDAARELFAAKGYAAATTREIAELAKVHEPMVYRRFGSKAQLFEATVLAPFNELISDYLDSFQDGADANASLEELARSFIAPFYDLLRESRDLVLALFAASQFHSDFSGSGTLSLTGLSQMMDRLEKQLEIEARTRAFRNVDVPAALRVCVAMVMGMAILGDWLQPEFHPVDRDRLVEEMVGMSIHGITRPPGDAIGEDAVATSSNDHEVRQLLDRVADAERRAIRAELELDVLTSRASIAQSS
jgi:AcrR family transcriptional regulator